jgi:hypothetical protein
MLILVLPAFVSSCAFVSQKNMVRPTKLMWAESLEIICHLERRVGFFFDLPSLRIVEKIVLHHRTNRKW